MFIWEDALNESIHCTGFFFYPLFQCLCMQFKLSSIQHFNWKIGKRVKPSLWFFHLHLNDAMLNKPIERKNEKKKKRTNSIYHLRFWKVFYDFSIVPHHPDKIVWHKRIPFLITFFPISFVLSQQNKNHFYFLLFYRNILD